MANESLDKWHTFPDEPDTWEDVETVYLVSEQYYLKSFGGKWVYELHQAFCLWDWENHRFVDVYGGEYFYALETDNGNRDYSLFWKVADLPPGQRIASRLYDEICAQGVEPFYVPERPPYTEEEVRSMIIECNWEAREGR